MACSRCGVDCVGPICPNCKAGITPKSGSHNHPSSFPPPPTLVPIPDGLGGHIENRSIAVRGRGSILPMKRGSVDGMPYAHGRPVLTNTAYVVNDGGNDEIYEEMLALKSALEAIGDRIKLLQPHPPLGLMTECKILAIKLDEEVERRRGR